MRHKFLLTLIILLPLVVFCRDTPSANMKGEAKKEVTMNIKKVKAKGIRYEVAGSSLPDCRHACRNCMPCTRVTVSFKCSLDTADACPIAYRCFCRGRIFPVPSARP